MASETPPITSVTPSTDSDNASPYFLNNGDNPGILLVSQVLREDNYPS